MKRSKRYEEALSLIERGKLYSIGEALDILNNISTGEKTKVKFEQTVEIAFNLNLKARHTIRDTTTLPHSISKGEKRILVFAKGEKAEEAQKAGATYVGDADLVEKIKDGWYDFDVAIATPDMMREVGKLGAVLGRRGLMPNPKTGTVTLELANAINEFKKGKMEYRADKTGIIHVKIGISNFTNEQLKENISFIYQEILRKKPVDLKGEYIKSVAISLAMSPGIKIQHQTIAA